MMYGNIIALAQTNIKRLLAYSSIASAGYIFVGVAAMNEFALKGIAYYLIAYTFMQLGAFIVVSILEKEDDGSREYKNIELDYYKGLGKRNPVIATYMTLFLIFTCRHSAVCRILGKILFILCCHTGKFNMAFGNWYFIEFDWCLLLSENSCLHVV